jgi:hypothetical protein
MKITVCAFPDSIIEYFDQVNTVNNDLKKPLQPKGILLGLLLLIIAIASTVVVQKLRSSHTELDSQSETP